MRMWVRLLWFVLATRDMRKLFAWVREQEDRCRPEREEYRPPTMAADVLVRRVFQEWERQIENDSALFRCASVELPFDGRVILKGFDGTGSELTIDSEVVISTWDY